MVGGVTSLVMRQSSWYGKVGRIGPISLPGLLLALALAALIVVEEAEQFASAADTSARQIEVGRDHACVLEPDGRVTCWGDDSAGR